MALSFAYFFAMYLIAGTIIRLITMKFPDSAAGRALMFAH